MTHSRTPAKTHKKTEWDLTLLYTGIDDPQIEKDVAAAERACAQFAKTFGGVSFVTNLTALHKALVAGDKLSSNPAFERPLRYLSLRRELDAADSAAEKKINLFSDRLTKAGNLLIFFELALGNLPAAVQKKVLADKRFAPYRYALERTFLEAKYNLTEPEEKILSLKSAPASGLWIAGSEKILNQRSIRHGSKEVPLMEALTNVSRLPKGPRRALWKKAIAECKAHADIAEMELNAIVLNKKINDELRGYARPYSATVLGNENTDTEVAALAEAVTERFDISARFYALKAKLHKEKVLLYPDRSASYGKSITIPFADAVETLRGVFSNLNPIYGKILDDMLAHRQIDVYPKKGKAGGAFCSSATAQPTYVLLNQVDDIRSLTTFAHEMGHAIHSERSKQQPPRYQGYSTATAETASTLFENLVFESLLPALSPRERASALHEKLGDEMASIMRQIAFFNYEVELHETIRREGSMTKEEMAAMMQKHLAAYLGPKVSVSEDDGYTFVYVSHFRMFFYVYTYAYGSLVSNVLARRWREDPTYITDIDRFLSAGGSATPEAIFKDIGVDTTKPTFFREGLAVLDERVSELETLVKAQKLA